VVYHAGQNFVLSLFDRLWHKDLTDEEAVKLMELGIEEVSL
jgi:20S proteasome alpha/beta subunit